VPKFVSFLNPTEKFSIQSEPLPELKEGEILVRNLAVSICKSDLHTYGGKRIEKSPVLLGHEVVGRVESFGLTGAAVDVTGKILQIGNKVTWAIFSSSPLDRNAQRGMPQKAEELFKYGHEKIEEGNHFHGGLSEYTIIRKDTPIAILKEEIPNEVASLINCTLATVAGAIRLAEGVQDKSVAIYGAGMLGVAACAMASRMGAKKIVTLDLDKERGAVSKKFGAAAYFLPTELVTEKFDVVLEFTGATEAMEHSVRLAAIGGITVWVGAVYPQEEVRLHGEFLVRNLLTIKGLHNYNLEDFAFAASFLEEEYQNFDFMSLIKGGFLLDEVEEAFQFALNQNPYRVSLTLESK